MTVRDALALARARLHAADIADAAMEVRHLFTVVTSLTMNEQIRQYDHVVSDSVVSLFFSLVERRVAGEPLAYLSGSSEFAGLSFHVGPGVLAPRPETEQLVYWWCEQIKAHANVGDQGLRIVDIGTGSGVIGLSTAHLLAEQGIPVSHLYLVDVSEAALAYARRNAALLTGHNIQIAFVTADLYPEPWPSVDIVLSNPPYIDVANDRALDAGVLRYEPRLALDGGAAGMTVYRRLAVGLSERLQPGAFVGLEHGYQQAELVRSTFLSRSFDALAQMIDYGGHVRGQCFLKT